MKRILFTLLFLVAFLAGYSQMSNNGGTITVENGATLVIEGSYTSSSGGSIEIDGNVQLKGNFVNNGGNINSGSTGTLTLNGTSAQQIGGTVPTDFYCSLVVNNTTGVSLTGADEVLYAALTLTNGKLTLNAYDLTMAAVGITASASNYVVTNNAAGELKAAVGASDVTFPVGTASSYNPVKLNNTGDLDTYGVVFTGAMPGGWTGTDHAVTGNWAISEGLTGGSNLTVTTQWNGGDEQASFDRTNSAVGVSADNGATVTWASSGAAGGTDPYTKDGAGFTSVGTFLVGDAFYLAITLNLNVILAGPYDGLAMSTALNTQGLIPLTDPYVGTTTVTTIPSGVVDWVLVEFRNKLDASIVLYSKAFFLDSDGQLLNPANGAVGAKVTGVPKDQYYISVKHRNHLGVMTLNTVDLTAGSASFDFTDPLSGVYGTNPLYDWGGSGVMTLWGGDADGDGQVIYLNAPSDLDPILTVVYYDPLNVDFLEYWITGPLYDKADTNLDGTVVYLNAPSDLDPILTSVYYDPGNVDFLEYWTVVAQLPIPTP
jgi:hypothetical protein